MKIKLLILLTSLFIMSCGKNDAEDFFGNFSGNVICEDDTSVSFPTSITISEGSDDNKVKVTITSDGETFIVDGNVDGNKINIPIQEIGEFEEVISGSGTLNGDDLTIDFITDGVCTFEGSK